MALQEYNMNFALTAVDVVSDVNLVGTYNNGPLNNGVESFLTIPLNVFSIDSKTIEIGTEILLIGQTNKNENGIYICIQTGGIYSFSVIKRRNDFHSVEQIKAGQYISVGDGILNKGSIYCVVSPIPNFLGIDDLIFITASSNFKRSEFDFTNFTGKENFDNLVILSGNYNNFTNPINNPISNTPQLVNEANILEMNGITKGFAVGTASLFLGHGTFTSDATVISSGTDINLGDATVDGAAIIGRLINIMPIGTPTNISNVIPDFIINSSGLTLPAFKRYSGDASFFFSAEGVSTYVVTAGVGGGQAGDPGGCNAQEVLLISINGNTRFIPLFDTN